MHPLDVVKTRLQVQKDNKYTSISGCFRSIIKNEGFFAIYKGIIPPIFAESVLKHFNKLYSSTN